MVGPYPKTLPGIFDNALGKYADRTAIRDGERTLTYGELDEQSAALAVEFVEGGIETGDPVGVVMANRAELPIVDLAIMRSGAARLPLNHQYARDELVELLERSYATVVCCDGARFDTIADVAPDLDTLERIIVVDADIDDTSEGDSGAISDVADRELDSIDVRRLTGCLERGRDTTSREAGDTANTRPGPDDTAGHYFTGGTTGEPKAVRYTHRCLVENLQAHLLEFGFSDQDVGLLAPPLSHSAGTFCWAALLGGSTVIVQDGFDPGQFLETIERESVTWTFMVPTMIYRLLDAETPAVDDVDLSSIERILYGAAPMRTDRLGEAIDRLGPVFHQFYGQTEVPNLITTFPPREHAAALAADDEKRLSSAGTACIRAAVEIRDGATGVRLSPGEVGEVVVAAPYTFDGYVGDPEATAETRRDGWVYTGDIGRLDEECYLTLLDRANGVIVTGGLNVYSRNVEETLREHPAVEDAIVIGVPHDEWGEAVHAVVVAADEVSEDELRSFVGERAASYKKPKSIEFVDALPTTALGKTDREAIRDRHWQQTDRSIH